MKGGSNKGLKNNLQREDFNMKNISLKTIVSRIIGMYFIFFAGSEAEFTTCSDWWLLFLMTIGFGFLYVSTKFEKGEDFYEE